MQGRGAPHAWLRWCEAHGLDEMLSHACLSPLHGSEACWKISDGPRACLQCGETRSPEVHMIDPLLTGHLLAIPSPCQHNVAALGVCAAARLS